MGMVYPGKFCFTASARLIPKLLIMSGSMALPQRNNIFLFYRNNRIRHEINYHNTKRRIHEMLEEYPDLLTPQEAMEILRDWEEFIL